ncbi:methyltransferase RsmF C-terminal domain-like protein [Roseivirga sp.]|uniref:methyltransferase RsmF C-terminal domain-like protein n=1 Tax=Roseivirga sp. TaxID=1964215 RepID=UPI003B51F995
MFPTAFQSQIQQLLTTEADAFFQSLDTDSPTSIRFNPSKNYSGKLEGHKIPWTDNGIYLKERPSFTLDPDFHSGAYYVQEASSMVLEQILKQSVNLKEDLLALDLCAAPGGKSTHIQSLLSSGSLLVSNEVIKSRANILAENLTKWGLPNKVITNNDPSHFDRLNVQFDLIVVDAPCSGEGLFRRDPEAMKEWSPEAMKLCATRQQRILADIWPSLKPGGVLIYSTCTYNSLENEENIQWLNEQLDAKGISLELENSWGFSKTQTSGIDGFHAYPHKVKGEGFFITAVTKTEGRAKKLRKSKKPINFAPRQEIENISPWLKNPEFFDFIKHNDLFIAMPEHWKDVIHEINSNLYIVAEGIEMGRLKGKKLIPHEALAFSTELNHSQVSTFELELDEALNYLRKESFDFDSMENGWNLITHKGLGLGWANRIQQRVNNYYPTNWRVRISSNF